MFSDWEGVTLTAFLAGYIDDSKTIIDDKMTILRISEYNIIDGTVSRW